MFTANKPNCGEIFVTYKTAVPQKDLTKVHTSRELEKYFRDKMFDQDMICFREEMGLVLLSRCNKVIGWCRISVGGFSSTLCDPKLVFYHALHCGASNIALAHNHPSGNLTPSSEDKRLTDKINDAAELFDIRLLDHLIITEAEYFSFADNGLI